MNEKTIYWFLKNDQTGESVVVGSFRDVVAERNRIAAKYSQFGAEISFENRRRKLIVDHEYMIGNGTVRVIHWTYTIGRVSVPAASVD